MVERALEAEMTDHLGYEPHEADGRGTGNSRNGKSKKTVQSEAGQFEIEVPRDRNGSFEPQMVKKRQRRLEGFDDKVLALYARGQSTREIQAQLQELYGVEVSPALISNVTDAVHDEVRAWQSRPLSAVYPILYFDLEGEKELLGLWMNETEGATVWLSVFNDLKTRGVEDCFIACVDGLKGLPEAIEAVFPRTQV